MKPKGWKYESGRHALAARGVKTKSRIFKNKIPRGMKAFEVIIGSDGKNENGQWGTRYDRFLILVNEKKDDPSHTWFGEWEGGAGTALYFPKLSNKQYKVKHIETWGEEDIDFNPNSVWREEFRMVNP